MSMIIKGREIVLSDYAQITAKIRNENKTVDVFWYLEKVDENVYPYDDDHAVDYILGVCSHITDYTPGSLYPMDRMYFFMIHNEKYRVYTDPENIKTTIALKDIITNDIIYETSANNSTRYSGNYTFNRIAKLDKQVYDKFNGIPEDKYQEIMDILGKDRCNSICIDTAMIQSDIGDGDHPLSNTCYLYDNYKQITCKLVYPNNDDLTLKPVSTEFNGSVTISTNIVPIDMYGSIDVANEINPKDINANVDIANSINPSDVSGSVDIIAIDTTDVNGTVDIIAIDITDVNGTVEIEKDEIDAGGSSMEEGDNNE